MGKEEDPKHLYREGFHRAQLEKVLFKWPYTILYMVSYK